MRRFSGTLLFLFGVVVVAAVIIATRDDPTVFGLDKDDFARLSWLGAILVALVAGIVGRGALAQAVRYSLSWVIVMALLVAGYSYRGELEWIGRRMMAELVPGMAILEDRSNADGQGPVMVVRTASGQFRVSAGVNGEAVEMLIDTGASVVTLTSDDAFRAGIDTEGLNFSIPVFTANGTTTAAPVIIDRLQIGPIERSRVVALVARPGRLDRSLLGMTFLDTLGSYSISGDRMTLTP